MPEQEKNLFQRGIDYVKNQEPDKALRLATMMARKQYRQYIADQALVFHTMLNDILGTDQINLPWWVQKDAQGSIMVYPGTPSEGGYALNGKNIEHVPSIYGAGREKTRVDSKDLGHAFETIINQRWENSTAKFS